MAAVLGFYTLYEFPVTILELLSQIGLHLNAGQFGHLTLRHRSIPLPISNPAVRDHLLNHR
jgi:hypothetical protein